MPVPPVKLVEWLDTVFPDRWPRLSESDRHIWFAAGQRSVVALLKARLKDLDEEGAPLLSRG
jgi:hypothetical protein